MFSQYREVVFIHSDQGDKIFPSTLFFASNQSKVSEGPYAESYNHRKETWNLDFLNAPYGTLKKGSEIRLK